MEKYDAILALSFGKGAGKYHNFANLTIASLAIFFGKLYNVFVAADASVPIHKLGYSPYRTIGRGHKQSHESTVEILESALFLYTNLAEKEKIKAILVITAPAYIARALRDARKVFKNTGVEFRGLSVLGEEWFCPDSTQLCTSHEWIWWIREIILRALPFHFYRWLTKKLA